MGMARSWCRGVPSCDRSNDKRGVIVLLVVAPLFLLMLLPGSAAAEFTCAQDPLTVTYTADTLPENDPAAPWEFMLTQDIPPYVHAEDGLLYMDGYEAYLANPEENNNGYLYYRQEPALDGASRFTFEARFHLVDGRYPEVGPDDAAYAVYGVVDDGERGVAITTGPDPEAGLVLVLGAGELLTVPCATWFLPTTYRMEVDKTASDPAQHSVDIYVDGMACVSVPYEYFATGEGFPAGLYFGGRDSDSVWDFVAYEICEGVPVERPPMEEQIANMQEEAAKLDAPGWLLSWLDRRLEQIGLIENPDRQAQALYEVSRHTFIMKRTGIIDEDAGRLETQLDFARTTADPYSSREQGYFRSMTITARNVMSSVAVPGQTSAKVLLDVDLRPTARHVSNPGDRSFALMARTSVVEVATGYVVRVKTEFVSLPETLPAGQIHNVPDVEFEWNGLQDDVTPVSDGLWSMNTSIQYVELDDVGRVVGYFDGAGLQGDIIVMRPNNLTQPSQILYSDVMYPAYYQQSCLRDTDCESIQDDDYDSDYGAPICAYYWHFADSQRRCVRACTMDENCVVAFGDGWACWSPNPGDDSHDATFPGYCFLKNKETGSPHLVYDTTNGWSRPEYENSIYFLNIKVMVDDLISFHEEDMNGIWSYLYQDLPYRVHLQGVGGSYGENQHPTFGTNFPSGRAGAWSSAAGRTYVYYWNALQDGGVYPPNNTVMEMFYNLFSHEFTHALMSSLFDGEDCLEENIPGIFGSLLAVKEMGGATTRIGDTTPWRDKTCGLEPGCNDHLMPFAQRSAFDWMECFDAVGVPYVEGYTCPPYLNHVSDGYWCANRTDIHNNGHVWSRFLRVLTEGTATFELDGNGEDVGVELEYFPGTGIGLPNTIDIVFEATMRAAESYASTSEPIGLLEWVDLLHESGCDLGFCGEIEKALGIAGFFSDRYSLHLPCEGAPSAASFSAWSGSGIKDFIGFKNRWSDEIGVRYHTGNGSVVDWIPAYTDGPPALIEYEGRLYVFWRVRGTGSISYLWYEPDGSSSVVHTLHELRTGGAFDVAVFDNRLHVIYTDAEDEVRIGWCSPLIVGGECSWHRFENGELSKGLGFFALPGLGADAGPGLAGTSDPEEEYLYVATAFAGPYFAARIKIYQVDRDYEVAHALWMPGYYPSYQTLDEIAVELVRSAFPNGNYLYLAWRDNWDSRMYKAVLRHLDDASPDWELGHEDYWITWSHDTQLAIDSGVRFKKGAGVAASGVDYYFELQDWLGIANQVGLY